MLPLIGAAVLALGMATAARAQFPPPPPGPNGPAPGKFGPESMLPRGPDMGGVFSFVEPLSDVHSHVVKGAPFSAQIVRETVQQLPDGNVIDHKSTGNVARDNEGRTRRQMTLENIGPWASAGQPPVLVFITDPVAQKMYTLDENRKIAYKISPPPKIGYEPRQNGPRSRRWTEFKSETQTESLGEKTMDGLVVEGTRITRTIPAGQIGNEKPIVISTERWYSPALQTVILQKRTDPRFGTTTLQLSNIDLSEPSPSLFTVPSDFTEKSGRPGRRPGRRPGPGSDFP
ncbi:MAG: hypothetical protein KGL59_01330 [Acidobacteriota bacterium]|nr:hypothetical protein [Acidobacteriota bacterium]